MLLCSVQKAAAIAEGVMGGVRLGVHTTFAGTGEHPDKVGGNDVEIKSNMFNIGGGGSLWGGYKINLNPETAVGIIGGVGAKHISVKASGKIKEGGDDKKINSYSSITAVTGVDAFIEGVVEQRIGDMGFFNVGLSAGGVFPVISKKIEIEVKKHNGTLEKFPGILNDDDHRKEYDELLEKIFNNNFYARFALGYTEPSKIARFNLGLTYSLTSLFSDSDEAKAVKKILSIKEDKNISPINADFYVTLDFFPLAR